MERSRRLPLADWPAADRGVWQRTCQEPHGLFDEAGAAHKLRPLTRRNYERAYGTWLAYLCDSSTLDLAAAPAARVNPERLDGWLAAMRGHGLENGTMRQYIIDLYSMLRLIEPKADLGYMLKPRGQRLSAWLPVEQKPAPPVDVADLMKNVDELHRQGLAAATPFAKRGALRDAALLAILARRAPRVSNVAMMRLGRHLQPMADGRFEVRFAASEMKAKRSLCWPLDDDCSRFMRDYLDLGRGLFAGAVHTDLVWLGHNEAPMGAAGIAALVRRYTIAWFGVARGPHTARKWLRNSAARRSPGAAFDAAEVCGHSLPVALQHYADATDIGAAMRHGRHLQELRRKTALLARRSYGYDKGEDEDDKRTIERGDGVDHCPEN